MWLEYLKEILFARGSQYLCVIVFDKLLLIRVAYANLGQSRIVHRAEERPNTFVGCPPPSLSSTPPHIC